MKSQLINSSFEIKEGSHSQICDGCNVGMLEAPTSFIFFNNKKGLIKIIINEFGIGYVRIPLQQTSEKANSNLWKYLEIEEIK